MFAETGSHRPRRHFHESPAKPDKTFYWYPVLDGYHRRRESRLYVRYCLLQELSRREIQENREMWHKSNCIRSYMFELCCFSCKKRDIQGPAYKIQWCVSVLSIVECLATLLIEIVCALLRKSLNLIVNQLLRFTCFAIIFTRIS